MSDRVCPRCKVKHDPTFYKKLYEDWFYVYLKHGSSQEVAAKSALKQTQKHTPLGPTEPPWWLRVGTRVIGGKKVTEQVKNGWRALDGKKTAIGAVLTFLVLISPEVHDLAVQLGITQTGLAYVTTSIMVVGAAHKVWKKFFGDGLS